MAKPDNSDNAETLDMLLLALQKTLSRVSRDSSNINPGAARSLIAGNVAFTLSCRCDYAEGDHILLKENGGVEMSLSGKINTDISVENVTEKDNVTS